MKKIICGVTVTVIGLVFSTLFIIYAMQNPGSYNDIDGLLGALAAHRLLFPLIVSAAITVFGVGYSFWIAYKE